KPASPFLLVNGGVRRKVGSDEERERVLQQPRGKCLVVCESVRLIVLWRQLRLWLAVAVDLPRAVAEITSHFVLVAEITYRDSLSTALTFRAFGFALLGELGSQLLARGLLLRLAPLLVGQDPDRVHAFP